MIRSLHQQRLCRCFIIKRRCWTGSSRIDQRTPDELAGLSCGVESVWVGSSWFSIKQQSGCCCGAAERPDRPGLTPDTSSRIHRLTGHPQRDSAGGSSSPWKQWQDQTYIGANYRACKAGWSDSLKNGQRATASVHPATAAHTVWIASLHAA